MESNRMWGFVLERLPASMPAEHFSVSVSAPFVIILSAHIPFLGAN
jgi:hypothetical protein